ncbi:hypothetical protein G3I15_12320, partial [Streptomyces sp. SID10244]|nr:hypothetical protein [Streptomyces sp. SID10244]
LLATGSEAADGLIVDEPVEEVADTAGPTTAAIGGTPSLMNGMPFGAAFGTLVHEVLEYVDTDSTDITE